MVQSNFDPDFALAKDLSDLKLRLARLEQQTVQTTVDPGGVIGKPLVKLSDKDFDTAWQTLDVVGGGTGLTTATGYLKGAGSTISAVATPIPVADGGTGLSTATGYLKGAGSTISAITTPIPVSDGGSGAGTLTGYVYGNGTSAMTAATTIPVGSGGMLTGGTAGQVLQKNSGSNYDISWSNVLVSRNFLINGGFDFWQRGTSSTTTAVYITDRWIHTWNAGTATASRSTDVPATTLPYSFSLASTSGTNPAIQQRIEAINALPLVGQTVTFSIWAKSTVGTGGLTWTTYYPTTTVDTFSAVTGDQSGTFAATMTVGTWTRYSATFTVSANAVRGYLVQVFRNVTTTNTTTLFAGAQLEIGSVATAFSRNGSNIQAELSACQRYYIPGRMGGSTYFIGSTNATGIGAHDYTFLPMRVAPTATIILFTNVDNASNSGITPLDNGAVRGNFRNSNTGFPYYSFNVTFRLEAEL